MALMVVLDWKVLPAAAKFAENWGEPLTSVCHGWLAVDLRQVLTAAKVQYRRAPALGARASSRGQEARFGSHPSGRYRRLFLAGVPTRRL